MVVTKAEPLGPSSGLLDCYSRTQQHRSDRRLSCKARCQHDASLSHLLLATVIMCCTPTGRAADMLSEAITVATPTQNLEADQFFTLQWVYSESDGTTGDLYAFDVNLRSCGLNTSSCDAESGCGYHFASLCDRGGLCLDSDGRYKVRIPPETPGGDYIFSVGLATDEGIFSCSEAFGISSLPAEDSTDPSLKVSVPGSVEVGHPFTATWTYDNGTGGTAGAFEINLFSCLGGACDDGGCGDLVTNLCGSSGCYDPGTGDYDVVIPLEQALGAYKLEVKNMGDLAANCSEVFYVIEEGGDIPGRPGYPPIPVPEPTPCDPSAEISFEYTEEDSDSPVITVAHASGDRSEAGCLDLTKLWDYLSSGPDDVPTDLLYVVDPSTGEVETSLTATPTGTWLLRTSVIVTNGVTFNIHGTGNEEGDCDELKLSSDSDRWHSVIGHGGNIDIRNTLIRSWDEEEEEEHAHDEDADGDDPRSYIACISEVFDPDETCDGAAKKDMGECRMDITNSELGYLGYKDSESYGLSWKARGLCEDLSNRDSLFENVRVYGDIIDSDIHHMWYGMYSYGHLGGLWKNNLMHDNHEYGFDPHDDSDYLRIHNNTCYNNVNHGIIASKRCDHLSLRDNNCYDNGGSGIMLHKSCDDSVVIGNTCTGNYDAGLSLVETSRTTISNNTMDENRWGLRVTLGSTNNTFTSNVLIENTYNDIYLYMGASDEEPEVPPKTGINVNNVFHRNEIRYEVSQVVDVEDADGTEITENDFIGEGGRMLFLRAINTRLYENTGEVADADHTVEDSCFTEDSNQEPVCE